MKKSKRKQAKRILLPTAAAVLVASGITPVMSIDKANAEATGPFEESGKDPNFDASQVNSSLFNVASNPYNGNKVEVKLTTAGKAFTGDIHIPKTQNGLTPSVAKDFKDAKAKNIYFEDTSLIKETTQYAFMNTIATNPISFPNLEIIKDYSFNNSKFPQIHTGKKVTTIEGLAFEKSVANNEISLPELMNLDSNALSSSMFSKIYLRSDIATLGSGALTKTQATNVINVLHLTNLNVALFSGSSFEQILISPDLTDVPMQLFYGAKATNDIHIKKMNKIDSHAFANSNFKTIQIDDTSAITELPLMAFSGAKATNSISFPNVVKINNSALENTNFSKIELDTMKLTALERRALTGVKPEVLSPDKHIRLSETVTLGEHALNFTGTAYVSFGTGAKNLVNGVHYKNTESWDISKGKLILLGAPGGPEQKYVNAMNAGISDVTKQPYQFMDIATWVPEGINTAPESSTIPNQVLTLGEQKTLDLKPYFTDKESDKLTFEVTSETISFSNLPMQNGVLDMSKVPVGIHTVTVKANDGKLDSTPSTFTIEVKEVASSIKPPTLIGASTHSVTVNMTKNPEGKTFNLSSYFKADSNEASLFKVLGADASEHFEIELDSTTGILNVKPLSAGTETIQVYAENSSGMSTPLAVNVNITETSAELPPTSVTKPIDPLTMEQVYYLESGQTIQVPISRLLIGLTGEPTIKVNSSTPSATTADTTLLDSSLTMTLQGIDYGFGYHEVLASDTTGLTNSLSVSAIVSKSNFYIDENGQTQIRDAEINADDEEIFVVPLDQVFGTVGVVDEFDYLLEIQKKSGGTTIAKYMNSRVAALNSLFANAGTQTSLPPEINASNLFSDENISVDLAGHNLIVSGTNMSDYDIQVGTNINGTTSMKQFNVKVNSATNGGGTTDPGNGGNGGGNGGNTGGTTDPGNGGNGGNTGGTTDPGNGGNGGNTGGTTDPGNGGNGGNTGGTTDPGNGGNGGNTGGTTDTDNGSNGGNTGGTTDPDNGSGSLPGYEDLDKTHNYCEYPYKEGSSEANAKDLKLEFEVMDKDKLSLSLVGENVGAVEIVGDQVYAIIDCKAYKVGKVPAGSEIKFEDSRAIRENKNSYSSVMHYTTDNSLVLTTSNMQDVLIVPKVDEPFVDVLDNHWFKENIEEAYNYIFTKGKTATTYEPRAFISRGQFAAMIARALEIKENDKSLNYTLSDLEGQWYANDVQMLVNLGIITGYENGTFGGNDFLTREQAASIIVKTLKYLDVKTDTQSNIKFADEQAISSYAKSSVHYLANQGILVNGENVKFNPKDNLTRGQMAKILMQALKHTDKY